MSAIITIQFTVPVGYEDGDYAQLHGDSGSGTINWSSPINNDIYPLFPNGIGIYGWSRCPWGHFPFGRGYSLRTDGWAHLPWGRFPWAHGSAIIITTHEVNQCGKYKFGFACYDKLGNVHEGTPEEIEVNVHIAPPTPTGLKKNSYNKTTDVLLLDVA